MDKVRIGIIGLGNMGMAHLDNIKKGNVKNVVISALCDVKAERLRHAADILSKDVALYDNSDKLLASGTVDAVLIAVPHYYHCPIAIKALENNLNVLVEKPAGVYTKQVRELNEAASKSDKVFGIMFNQRTNPLYQKARDLVQSGELGEIKRTNWIITDWFRTQSYYDSGDWRATWAGEGGGVLMNQSPHQLDLWQWICGMPARVRGFCNEGKSHDIEVEDDVTAYVEYENGATGVFITSTGDAPGTNRFEVLGDKGKIVIENNKLSFWRNRVSSTEFSKTSKEGFASPETWLCEIPITGTNTQHAGIMNNFIDAILTGSPLLASGTEGINGVMLANAIYLSSWTDKWISLPINEDEYYSKLKEKIDSSKYKKNVMETVADLAGTY